MAEFDIRRILADITVVTGHFGAGKTNFSANLSSALSDLSHVYLIDYDNVNPYFRALDAKKALNGKDVTVIASEFANTNVDIPSVPPEIIGALNSVSSGDRVVIDVGGDMLGAVSLGYIHDKIAANAYGTVYVFNAYRPLTSTPEEALGVMREIESASGFKTSYLVNNSNIGAATEKEDIEKTADFADKLSAISGVPLLCTCYMTESAPEISGNVFKIKNYTKRLF